MCKQPDHYPRKCDEIEQKAKEDGSAFRKMVEEAMSAALIKPNVEAIRQDVIKKIRAEHPDLKEEDIDVKFSDKVKQDDERNIARAEHPELDMEEPLAFLQQANQFNAIGTGAAVGMHMGVMGRGGDFEMGIHMNGLNPNGAQRFGPRPSPGAWWGQQGPEVFNPRMADMFGPMPHHAWAHQRWAEGVDPRVAAELGGPPPHLTRQWERQQQQKLAVANWNPNFAGVAGGPPVLRPREQQTWAGGLNALEAQNAMHHDPWAQDRGQERRSRRRRRRRPFFGDDRG
ncbi:hypothetical protein LTS18_008003 [Coniosporium uncinatum]|uniref:Uncharacterized protein n=1 Tax=Coniosporium uncinatum TaxID=93489 RepID=A0ACC3D211_9PEZI|nr:hypothetical protein LTS18_008003 [Coniosporium uncinatum]